MYNFSKIKNTYNLVYLDYFKTKDKKLKSLFEFYIRKIKSSNLLKEEFNIYSVLNNSMFESDVDAQNFITECVIQMSLLNNDEMSKLHTELSNKLVANKYELSESESNVENLFEKYLNIKRKSGNLPLISETSLELRKSIIGNVDPKETLDYVNIPSDVLTSIMVDKFNNKYSSLDEGSRGLFNILMDDNDDSKKTFLNNSVKECLNKVNSKLLESSGDLDLKTMLLSAKEKLLSIEYSPDTFTSDVSRVIDLKSNIN